MYDIRLIRTEQLRIVATGCHHDLSNSTSTPTTRSCVM